MTVPSSKLSIKHTYTLWAFMYVYVIHTYMYCCWCFTHFCHCAMACCSQLPTLLSPAPHAAQLIRALSLSWSPALIPIPRRGRSNCHKTPTALDTKSTRTHTLIRAAMKKFSQLSSLWNGRSFLGSLWCFSFFLLLCFLASSAG